MNDKTNAAATADDDEDVLDPEIGGTDHDGADENDTEARARRMGWKPQDEYRGPADKWVSAEEFLKRAVAPEVMVDRYRVLDERFAKMERQNSELTRRLEEATGVIRDLHTRSVRSAKAAFERGLAEARAELRRAEEEEDLPAFKAAQSKVEQLEQEFADVKDTVAENERAGKGKEDAGTEPPKKPANDAEVQVDPETRAWVDGNPWFTRDALLNSTMIFMNGDVRQEHPDWSVTDVLEEAKRRVMAKYPEKFGENPKRNAPGAVNAPGSPSGGGKRRGYDDLPAADKRACDAFIANYNRSNPPVRYTREMWLKDYDWE